MVLSNEEQQIYDAFWRAGAVFETDRATPGDDYFAKSGRRHVAIASQPSLLKDARFSKNLRPHFLLRSGRHTKTFFQVSLALRFYHISEMVAMRLCRLIEERGLLDKIDVILGPPMGALPVVYALQHCIRSPKIEAAYLERDWRGNFALGRGFNISEKQVLFIDDVLTSGGAVAKARDACEAFCIERQTSYFSLGIAVVLDRSPVASPSMEIRAPTLAVMSALKYPVEDWDEYSCPPCAEGHPLYKL